MPTGLIDDKSMLVKLMTWSAIGHQVITWTNVDPVVWIIRITWIPVKGVKSEMTKEKYMLIWNEPASWGSWKLWFSTYLAPALNINGTIIE